MSTPIPDGPGTIVWVDDQGTIVTVWLELDGRKVHTPVFFDHRMFHTMAESEQGDLVGRRVRYHGPTLEFLED